MSPEELTQRHRDSGAGRAESGGKAAESTRRAPPRPAQQSGPPQPRSRAGPPSPEGLLRSGALARAHTASGRVGAQVWCPCSCYCFSRRVFRKLIGGFCVGGAAPGLHEYRVHVCAYTARGSPALGRKGSDSCPVPSLLVHPKHRNNRSINCTGNETARTPCPC